MVHAPWSNSTDAVWLTLHLPKSLLHNTCSLHCHLFLWWHCFKGTFFLFLNTCDRFLQRASQFSQMCSSAGMYFYITVFKKRVQLRQRNSKKYIFSARYLNLVYENLDSHLIQISFLWTRVTVWTKGWVLTRNNTVRQIMVWNSDAISKMYAW